MHLPRTLAALAIGWAATSSVVVAQPKSITASKEEKPSSHEILRRYLLDQARRHFDARRQAIAAIKTPDDIARRQKDLRAFFLRSLGDLPERTPLNARVVGTLRRDRYRVEKVIFESQPDHHVTANLYVPDGEPPFPGVLLPCGHSENGKSYQQYQRMSILLARDGMAVLCYDPIGQGERLQMLDRNGKPVVRNTTEHTMAGIGALLVGGQLASYRIWDGIRALDYLASRPEVDGLRLGCTGNSGGGTITSYLMALDDRIAVAAPSCYITSLERLFATIGPQDAEQNITGQVAAGMEHADYLTLRAPKPTLMTVGTRDFFDIQGSWDSFREVKLIYGRLGFGERVDLFESDEEHGFTRPRRIATARWFKRWLLKQDDAVQEPDFPVEGDTDLQCTRTGQVLSDFKGISVFDLNRRRESVLRRARENTSARLTNDAFRAGVQTLLGLNTVDIKPVVPRAGEETAGRALTFEVEPGLTLSALELSPGNQPAGRGPALVKVGADWDQERAASGGAGSQQAADRVVLIDPRGMGATSPKSASPGDRPPFGRDWQEAFIALAIGRPLLGQRVADLLAVLAGLGAAAGATEHVGFHVVGIGAAGPVVLHAALLDKCQLIKKITIERSLVSWADVVNSGLSRDQMGNVVPGVLKVYDLPDVAARLAPVPLAITGAVNARGEPVSQDALDQAYARCTLAYGRTGQLILRGGQGLKPSR